MYGIPIWPFCVDIKMQGYAVVDISALIEQSSLFKYDLRDMFQVVSCGL